MRFLIIILLLSPLFAQSQIGGCDGVDVGFREVIMPDGTIDCQLISENCGKFINVETGESITNPVGGECSVSTGPSSCFEDLVNMSLMDSLLLIDGKLHITSILEDCTLSGEVIDSTITIGCVSDQLEFDTVVMTSPLPQSVVDIPDIITSPLGSGGWLNNFEIQPCPIWGDQRLSWTSDNTNENFQHMVGLESDAPTDPNWPGEFMMVFQRLSTLNRVRIYQEVDGGFTVPFTSIPIGVNDYAIERIGSTITFYVNGAVFHTQTTNYTGELYFTNNLYMLPTGLWTTGQHIITNITHTPL